jgi:hypothetical protein
MSADYMAAIAAAELRPALFVEAWFRTGPIYVWSGVGELSWGGHTWVGIGTLGSVSTIEEGATVEAKGVTLSMSGIDIDLLDEVLNEFQVGLPALVYLGLFDADGDLIPDPVISWAGRIDQPTIDIDENTATISIACENRLVDMNVAVDRRYTNEDQQLDHPGDRGFEFVPAIQDVMIYWGRSPSSSNNI